MLRPTVMTAVQMQQFAEKLLARINRMKKQLMDKTSAPTSALATILFHWLDC